MIVVFSSMYKSLPEFWICFFHLNPHLLQITEENMLTGPLAVGYLYSNSVFSCDAPSIESSHRSISPQDPSRDFVACPRSFFVPKNQMTGSGCVQKGPRICCKRI